MDGQCAGCDLNVLGVPLGIGNIPVPRHIIPSLPRNAAANHRRPVTPAPEQAPRLFGPDISDPYVTALRMHRERMTELENSFQAFMANMRSPDPGDALPGPDNMLQNIRELLSSMHAPISNLNREYVHQLGDLIELLDAFEGNEQELPEARPIPAARAASASGYNVVDDDDDAVPDIPGFPDAWLDAMLDEEADLERALEASAAAFGDPPAPRSENAQRGVSHGFMTRISPLSLGPGDRQCLICMQDIGSDGEHPLRLDCGHVFGHRCIERWFDDNTTCPVCRRNYDGEL